MMAAFGFLRFKTQALRCQVQELKSKQYRSKQNRENSSQEYHKVRASKEQSNHINLEINPSGQDSVLAHSDDHPDSEWN